MTVHGTQGAGLEGCSLDVDTEQLIAERVHASPCLRSPHLARTAACRQKIVGPHTITITIIAAAGITQKLVAHAHPQQVHSVEFHGHKGAIAWYGRHPGFLARSPVDPGLTNTRK
jgi:hypothetical protein